MQRCPFHMDAGKDVVQSRRCICTSGSFALRYAIHIKDRSHRMEAKAKKVKEQSEEIKEKISNIKENFRFRVCFRSV